MLCDPPHGGLAAKEYYLIMARQKQKRGAAIAIEGLSRGREPIQLAVDCVVVAASKAMVCMLLGGAAPRHATSGDDVEQQSLVFRHRLHEERLKAIGSIIKHRPAVAAAMEQRRIDSSPMFELDLLTDWSNEAAARERTGSLERVYVVACRLRAVLHAEGSEPRPAVSSPTLLTDLQASIWKCLDGKALLSKEIRKLLPRLPSDEAVRKHVQAIRARGHDIQFVPQQGYVRPDAPPSESV